MLERAVTLAHRSGDLSGESVALDNLGSNHSKRGKFAQAIPWHQRALGIARAIKDPRAEAGALASLMTDYRLLGRTSQAIFYGKLSVAAWERLRLTVRNLGAQSRKSFIWFTGRHIPRISRSADFGGAGFGRKPNPGPTERGGVFAIH